MEFVPLEAAHIPALAPIAATAPDPWREAAMRQALEGENRRCLVALESGAPVGFACLRLGGGDAAELEMLCLAPALRGRGLGTQLLQAALAEIQGHAARCLLEVRAGNAAAIRLYERAGFKTLARRPRLYGHPPEDGLTMEIVL